MFDFMTPISVVATITFGIYKLFELFVCKRERLAIIDKLSDKFTMPALDKLTLPDYSRLRFSFGSLKAGCLLVGIGLGLLIGFIICICVMPNHIQNFREYYQTTSIVYGASVLLFGGVGLITAFIVETKIANKKE